MQFIFVIPVYNEVLQLDRLASSVYERLRKHPGSRLMLVNNGSSDGSQQAIKSLQERFPDFIQGLEVPHKGQGRAFKLAMQTLASETLPTDSWVIFSAADLPFGFSDLDQVESLPSAAHLIIGSKAHPRSAVRRGFKRALVSACYRCLRRLLLGMKSHDPQGSLFFRPALLSLHQDCSAPDFFFTTQFVYAVERSGHTILEIPIQLNSESRPSKINPLQDGWRVLKRTLRFALRHGRIGDKSRCSMLK